MSSTGDHRITPDVRYVPAAGRRGLTRLYDPAIAVLMREHAFRERVVNEVASSNPQTILDVGCGTGTLAIQLARRMPTAAVTGLDGDPEILDRASNKIRNAGSRVKLVRGLADHIPIDDSSIDCVVSSLVFHHLHPEQKRKALSEIARILTPGGKLVIADWGRPQDLAMRLAFLALQLLDGFATTQQHATGEFPKIVTDAGFAVAVTARMRTVLGTLEFLSATPTTTAGLNSAAPKLTTP